MGYFEHTTQEPTILFRIIGKIIVTAHHWFRILSTLKISCKTMGVLSKFTI